jgi:hypothetical protein
MSLRIFFLTCLFLTKFCIQPTTCAVPANIKTLELEDVTALPNKFPSIIDKIEETGMLFKYYQKQGHTFEDHSKTNIFITCKTS